jgi:hypothetical protein
MTVVICATLQPLTVVVIVEGVLLALALLFVVALLRSHAEILRRLAGIEAAFDAGPDGLDDLGHPDATAAVGPGAFADTQHRGGGHAPDIAGQTLAGDAVKLSLAAGSPPTLLAFMGSGCNACVPLWQGLDGDIPLLAGTRLTVVTKGPEGERLARLLELAQTDIEVVMSTQAWQDFDIPATPHFVLVDGGEIAGRGGATSWEQIASLLRDADDDRANPARNTSERAARAEQALAEAGIAAGHPSLYPSRLTPDPLAAPNRSAATDSEAPRE